jgi:hypothetical protein
MQKIKNGDIIEIPLNNHYGYGYAKFLNSIKIWGNKNLPDVLRIFKFSSLKPVNDLGAILDRELLIAPVAIGGSKNLLKNGCRVIGNELITETDKFLPHVKSGWPHFDTNPKKWIYYEDLGDTTKMHFADYDKVKNLEYSRVLDISILPFRIIMEQMKLEGKDIQSVKEKFDWLEDIEYKQSNSIAPYSSQNATVRGRVLK